MGQEVDLGAYEISWRLYVNASEAANGDGHSWATAYNKLQTAINRAPSDPCTIWVAGGVYYPDEGDGVTEDTRSATIQLRDNLEIYGGFAGDETSEADRDPETNPPTAAVSTPQISYGGVGTNITANFCGRFIDSPPLFPL